MEYFKKFNFIILLLLCCNQWAINKKTLIDIPSTEICHPLYPDTEIFESTDPFG